VSWVFSNRFFNIRVSQILSQVHSPRHARWTLVRSWHRTDKCNRKRRCSSCHRCCLHSKRNFSGLLDGKCPPSRQPMWLRSIGGGLTWSIALHESFNSIFYDVTVRTASARYSPPPFSNLSTTHHHSSIDTIYGRCSRDCISAQEREHVVP
jgi:hypothetical protein